MVSSRDAREIALRKRIYTLRHSCTPPMSWAAIVTVLTTGSDGEAALPELEALKDPRSSIRYKYRAYVKELGEQLEQTKELVVAHAIEQQVALPVVAAEVGSADMEADLIFSKLKTVFNEVSRTQDENGKRLFPDPVATGGLAGVMFKYVKRLDERQKGAGGVLAMQQVITVVVQCVQEEDVEFQERFIKRLYDLLGEDIQRYLRLPGAGTGGVCGEDTRA